VLSFTPHVPVLHVPTLLHCAAPEFPRLLLYLFFRIPMLPEGLLKGPMSIGINYVSSCFESFMFARSTIRITSCVHLLFG
jgi:hypothetical protein